MRSIIALTILVAALSSCGTADIKGVTCRGGFKLSDGYRLRTVIEVSTDAPAISHSPLRCPNLEIIFVGNAANDVAVNMADEAARSIDGRKQFVIDAVGKIDHDKRLGVPLFSVTKVISYRTL